MALVIFCLVFKQFGFQKLALPLKQSLLKFDENTVVCLKIGAVELTAIK